MGELIKKTALAVIATAALGIVVLVIAGIVQSIPRLSEGMVVDKEYQPARSSVDDSLATDADGNVYMRYITSHYDAEWSVRVLGVDANGEDRAEWWSIGAGMYERIGIGDWVQRDKETGVVSIAP